MIGFHMQTPTNDWTRAVAKLPAGAVVLACNDLHLLRDAKAANPNIITVFRRVVAQAPSTDLEANKQLARQYFASFIDGTFWQQELWRHIDVYKEWNEYPMDAAHFSWLQAVQWVWRYEYQQRYTQLANKPLACVSRPIGNSIPIEFARSVTEYGNLLSYHNYTPVRFKAIYPNEWDYFSGRWTVDDATFRRGNVFPRWIFTEGGPILHPGDGHPLPNDGWLHQDCLNGDVEAYKAVLTYQLERISQWNAAHGNRAIGGVLFTTGNSPEWRLFQVDQPEMDAFADHIRAFTPGTPPPPTDPPPPTGCRGAPRVQYSRVVHILPQDATLTRLQEVAANAYAARQSIGFSYDDGGIGDLNNRRVILWDKQASERETFIDWYATHYPGVVVEFRP